MLSTVEKTILKHCMINESDKILVAFSGGCDSVSLCLALMELGFDFAVAHVNHMIRKEAEHDEDFVVQFAARHNLVCHTTRIDVPLIAKERKISLESAGRMARYDYFDLLASQFSYTKIAVAHNKNDNCETFLHNMIRGSGLGGLCGIPPVRDNIIRPLIDVDRKTIERYVRQKNETYVTDLTNESVEYTRNRIRHTVMPHILEINPGFMDNLCKTMEILRSDNNYLVSCARNIVEKLKDRAVIDKTNFMMLDDSLKAYALRIAYEHTAGTSKDFESKHISYILSQVPHKEHGKICDLCMNVHCVMEYGKIVFGRNMSFDDYEYELPVEGVLIINEAGVKITSSIIAPDEVDFSALNCEYFDFNQIPGSLRVRNKRNGDKIIPMGKASYKKLKEIFINEKIPLDKRNVAPVVLADEIMWVLGIKRASVYAITDKTEKVLKIQFKKMCEEDYILC